MSLDESAPAIACTLPPEDLRTRREELRDGLAQRVTGWLELPDGVSFRLPPGEKHEADAHAFVAFERGCCGFADFAVRPAADGTWVEIRGPEGTKDFVCAMLPGVADSGRPVPSATRLPRVAMLGAGGAAAALLCCATPALSIMLGAVGLASAVTTVGPWIDAVAIPVLLACVGVIAVGAIRARRSARACDC